jgi:RNA polymerase sigma-70 factor (ECF subfamily)
VDLSDVLLSGAGDARPKLAAIPALEERLARGIAEARRAWPALALADDVFLRHLAEKLAQEANPDEALGAMHVADLYFACACASGDAAAIAELEGRFMPRAAAYFARNGSLAKHADELVQLVRMRLLVADGVARPRIAEYGGRAPFGAWFRVVFTRFAINYSASHRTEPTKDDDHLFTFAGADPELAYLRTHHREDLEAAFKETLASLPVKTANLLRLFYLQDVPADAIGGLYGVTARTIQRWVAGTRSRILRDVEGRLGARLGLTGSQVGSLIAVMRSQLDVSICRFFERPRGSAP